MVSTMAEPESEIDSDCVSNDAKDVAVSACVESF